MESDRERDSSSSGPKRNQLVPLAPAPAGSSGKGASGAGSRGRRQVTAACEACRKRKSKCNAERPKCSLCVRHRTDCRYATAPTETHSQALKRKHSELQDRITPYEELFGLLKSKSETESLEILRRVRSGADVGSILRHARDGDLLIQLSLAPESRRRYEFPYISDMPASILVPDNLYLRSFVYETTFHAPRSHSFGHDSQREGYGDDRYLKPYHAAQVVEPNFSNVTVSKWTSVTSDDQLLRRLLNAYLYYQHPWTAAFHMDYFLKDMASGRSRFCSSLLVNSVLAAACHMSREIPDRTKFWVPQTLGYQFLAEAKRLWELESRKDSASLTTIQAAIVLSIVATTTAMDKVGTSYLLQAITMAVSLDMFSASMGTENEKLRRARAFTAWGLFCWQAWQQFYFTKPPFIRHPPDYPLPDPALDARWYGEIWIRYPLGRRVFATGVGHVVRANFELRRLMNDMAAEMFEADRPPRSTVAQVLDCKARLDSWFAHLPEPLTPTRVVLPDHIKIHLEYYGVLIGLMRLPLVESSASASAAANLEATWQGIIHHAEIRLETLLRLYYLRHSFESYDPLLMHWLMFLGDVVLQRLHHHQLHHHQQSGAGSSGATVPLDLESLRSTLILCAKGLYDQGLNYHIGVLVYRLLRSRMQASDLDLLRTHILTSSSPSSASPPAGADAADQDPPLMMQYVQAQWLAPIDTPTGDPSRRTLEYLLREYEKLSLGDRGADDVSEISSTASPGP
ncbi:DNA helicase rad5 [Hypoxylon texense]